MKYPYIFVLTLFLGLSTYGQGTSEKASFKEGNPELFLASTFLSLTNNQSYGKGTVIVSFTLTKDGQIAHAFPTQFDTQKNGINAILAIQKSAGKWSVSDKDEDYKIAFNFLPANNRYEQDVLMADKFVEKKQFKQALKYYNRAIAINPYEAMLFLKRAEVKYALNDMDGLKQDYTQCKLLQKEFLANVQLGLIKPKLNKQMTYINKEKK